MPPSLREWLPANHLAWFVLSSVEAMDLAPFYASYRSDGHGRPAHDPAMRVALLLYAYCKGQRSSRVIEHECVEDVAYRVIAANEVPDHTTIGGFASATRRHLPACSVRCSRSARRRASWRSGWSRSTARRSMRTRVVRLRATTSRSRRKILEQAAEVDRQEDEQFGDARGDELPAELRPSKAAAAGCARPNDAWTPSAPRKRARSARRDPSVFPSPSGALQRISRSSRPRTAPTRPTARRGRQIAAGWVRHRRRSSRPRRRRARST